MDEILDLPQLYLIAEVMSELKHHVAINEKPLAELLVMMSLRSAWTSDFRKRLNRIGAGLPLRFVSSLDRLALAMNSKCKGEDSGEGDIEQQRVVQEHRDRTERDTQTSSQEPGPRGRVKYTAVIQFDEVQQDEASKTSKKRSRSLEDSIESKRRTRHMIPPEDRLEHGQYRESSPSEGSDSDGSGDDNGSKDKYQKHRRRHESRRKRRHRSSSRSSSRNHWQHDKYRESSLSQNNDLLGSNDNYSSSDDGSKDKYGRHRRRSISRWTDDTDRCESHYRMDQHVRRHQLDSPGYSQTTDAPIDDVPQPNKIYKGHVRGVTDFGAFIRIHNVRGDVDGLVHISKIVDGPYVHHPSDFLQHSQLVWVKVKEVQGFKIDLSMAEVDQQTGEDLKPLQTQQQQQGLAGTNTDALERAKLYSRMNSGMILSRGNITT